MAKFLSQVYTSIRGKVGGIVYTKNQFAGLVARAFTAPTNPRTVGQTAIRSAFDVASIQWQLLTQADRDLWSDYAATLTYEGPHGTYKLPGRQVFISNITLAKFMADQSYGSVVAGVAPPTVAGFLNIGPVLPAPFTPPTSTGVSVSIGNPENVDIVALVQRSFSFNQTKNVHNGPWPFAGNKGLDIPSLTTGIADVIVADPDKAIFLRVIAVTEVAPHRISAPFIVRAVSVTNGP